MNLQDEMIVAQKNIFVVLGMSRSGTSVIARGLHALGIDLGTNLIPAKRDWNAKGFWEDCDIVYKINRKVMRALNYSWETESLIENAQNNDEIRYLKGLAIDLLKQRLASRQYWGFKDPRTSKLLPFWQTVFSTLNVNEHYVVALRNPLASAHSFAKLTKYDFETGLLLWLMHLIPAIDQTKGKKRVVVNYELMLKNPHEQLDRIRKNLNIPMITKPSDIDLYANEFLDKNLYHYEYSHDDLTSHPSMAMAPLCVKVYDLLMKVASDQITLEDEEFISSWNSIKEEYSQFHRIYCYVGMLFNNNRQLEKKIRSMQKSLFWKLQSPFRFCEEIFRLMKKKYRMKKQLEKTYG